MISLDLTMRPASGINDQWLRQARKCTADVSRIVGASFGFALRDNELTLGRAPRLSVKPSDERKSGTRGLRCSSLMTVVGITPIVNVCVCTTIPRN